MNEYFYEMTKDLNNREFEKVYKSYRKGNKIHEREKYSDNFHSEESENFIEDGLYACGY